MVMRSLRPMHNTYLFYYLLFQGVRLLGCNRSLSQRIYRNSTIKWTCLHNFPRYEQYSLVRSSSSSDNNRSEKEIWQQRQQASYSTAIIIILLPIKWNALENWENNFIYYILYYARHSRVDDYGIQHCHSTIHNIPEVGEGREGESEVALVVSAVVTVCEATMALDESVGFIIVSRFTYK